MLSPDPTREEFQKLLEENKRLEREVRRKTRPLLRHRRFLSFKKNSNDLGRGRRRKVSAADREKILKLVAESQAAGASKKHACRELGISERTFQRWTNNPGAEDGRRGPTTVPAHQLTADERREILEISTSPEFRG